MDPKIRAAIFRAVETEPFARLMNMELIELISNRQSVRKYTDKIVDKTKIKKCLEAARKCPNKAILIMHD